MEILFFVSPEMWRFLVMDVAPTGIGPEPYSFVTKLFYHKSIGLYVLYYNRFAHIARSLVILH